jgi:hypothetical protein
MTLTAIKKMTSRLTPAQKVKLAGDLLKESLPKVRRVPSYEEIERRADEVLSGNVKTISGAESKTRIDRLMSKIKRDRQARSAQ